MPTCYNGYKVHINDNWNYFGYTCRLQLECGHHPSFIFQCIRTKANTFDQYTRWRRHCSKKTVQHFNSSLICKDDIYGKNCKLKIVPVTKTLILYLYKFSFQSLLSLKPKRNKNPWLTDWVVIIIKFIKETSSITSYIHQSFHVSQGTYIKW